MKHMASGLIALVCAVSLAQPVANATEISPSPGSEDCTTHSVAAAPEGNFGKEATELEKDTLKEGILNGSIPHIAPIDAIDISRTVAVEDTNGMVYRIPLAGEFTDVDYILVQTTNNSISRVAETHIKQESTDSARLQVWIDGKPEFNNIVRESDAKHQTRGLHDAWNAFNSCLNNAGVPMAVVTAISIACGLLGAFTAGTGVPACVIGAAGLYTGTVSFCYARALKAL